MASPSSAVSTTEVEPKTSPARDERSFANNNLTEDEASDRDDGTPRNASRNTSRNVGTPDVQERRGGGAGRGGGRGRGGRDSSAAGGAGGAGGPGMFKDPSAIGKIRHLKKEDGEPLWRFDIQYDFLRAIFDDDHRVFTNSYEPDTMPKQCFADLYIDTMARSSKTSKILHDKLLTDREAAKNMAMVCLLVNIGRMNTTLNFFPEMRAQLRTYHAIPSLQANEKLLDYKQLQDAPRLKSILKGGTEDRAEPRSLDLLKETDVPRTNPVNLLFLICNNASKVAELHFPPGREFHDLIMKTNLTSESRARAFLWVVWFYLESDFTEEGCEENPFGAGVDYGVDVANQGVPVMVEMTPEEEALENIDTPVERAFGLSKKSLRAKILHDEQFVEMPPHKRNSRPSRPSAAATAAAAAKEAAAVKEAAAELAAGTDNERSLPPAILPRIRPSKHESDLESMRSTPPPRSLIRSFGGGGGGGATGSARRGGPHKFSLGDGGGPSPVRQPPLIQQLHQQQQMQQTRRKRKQVKPEGGRGGRRHRDEDDDDDDDDRANTSVAPSRKPRPPTAHQIAVENNRKQRIEYLLSRGMHRKHHRSRKTRRTEGAIVRALRRLEEVEDPFENSEDESNLSFNRDLFTFMLGAPQNMPTGTEFRERGFHGLVQLKSEPEDFGEEVSTYASAMRRACRRLNRWETDGMAKNMVVPTIKRIRVNVPPVEDEYRDPNETEEEQDGDNTLGMDADASMSMSFVETTPVPAAKKRRTAGGTGQIPAVAALSRGGRGGRTSTGRIPSNTPAAISARRRRAAKAAALAAANGDVTMSDAGTRNGSAAPGGGGDDGGAGDEDATVLASGAENEGEGEGEGAEGGDDAGDDTEDVASVSAAPPVNKTRVTIKKKTPGPSGLSTSSSRPRGGRSSKVKHEDDEDDDDTVNGGGADEEDELNDVDKALLGIGSDSE